MSCCLDVLLSQNLDAKHLDVLEASGATETTAAEAAASAEAATATTTTVATTASAHSHAHAHHATHALTSLARSKEIQTIAGAEHDVACDSVVLVISTGHSRNGT